MTNKRLISKIHKYTALYKESNSIKKWSEDLEIFLQRREMAKKHMKRCSTLLIIREMQIKTTMRYHFTPAKMTIIKKSKQ